MTRGKNYKNSAKKLDNAKDKALSLPEAIKAVKISSYSKFPGTIELKLAAKFEGTARFSVTYPNSFAKEQRILVLTDDSKKSAALEAGATYAGLDEYVSKIKDGWFDFDVVIATPSVMPKIAILGKYLGTRGMMPNPKAGTITDDLTTAVNTYKAGKTDFKADKTGVMHIKIGKTNMDDDKLIQNIETALSELEKSTGKNVKSMVKSTYLVPTMGKSVKVIL